MRKTVCVLIAVIMLVSPLFSSYIYAIQLEDDTVPDADGAGYEFCDVNRDGKINNKDVTLVFRFSVDPGTEIDKDSADFDMDGEINNKDAVKLFKYVSGCEIYPAIYKGEPAYETDGDRIIVDGVSYPNNKNMTNGLLYAVDDLGREVTLDASPYVSDGSKNVGIFYFLWLGQHGDDGVLDITKILKEGGAAAKNNSYEGWGDVGAMHFWGEPLYGYYYSKDKWVMRRHVDELTLAGVDFVYIDATNGYPYLTNAINLMSMMHVYNVQGFDAPQIVFYTHTKCAETVLKIYEGIYGGDGIYPDTWFLLDGKPLIIAYEKECREALGDEICDKFTFREPQWPNEAQKTNGWPWMDFSYPQRAFKNNKGEAEVVNVSVAQHNDTVCFSDSAIYGRGNNRGRSYHNSREDSTEGAVLYGYNFQEQWNVAIKRKVPYILVTGWNEWVAQRQDASKCGRASSEVVFIDTASMEYSRDIEPMRGGYFDNYYMQLIDNIRRYKGSAPLLVQNSKKVIDLNEGFVQWDDVLVTYTDPYSDKGNREAQCFGKSTYINKTGRNDIVNSKIIYDSYNIYFYVDTKADIVMPEQGGEGTFMQLFINVDMDKDTGFYGFDYIVNSRATSENTTMLSKAKTSGTVFDFEETAELSYKITDNKMMIKVPMEALGITDPTRIKFAFKWADSKTKITAMEQMYTDGDCAPHGRLSYIFSNYK